ncbi:MAG: MBL fold metallo-hydrolase, partial [Candidatus Nanopelagicales bacterium]
AANTLRTIQRLGRRPRDVVLIVITHWHVDHMRGAEELRRRTGARLAIHELDAPVLAGGRLPAKGRRVQEAIRRVFRVRPVTADLLLL